MHSANGHTSTPAVDGFRAAVTQSSNTTTGVNHTERWLSPRSSTRHAGLVFLFYVLLFTVFFSPVIFFGRLLAPGGGRLGDGLLYHLAYFQSNKLLWDPLLAGGFPMMADPQVMAWYPPAFVLSFLPGGWNVFVISAYVLASCFTYGYVYTLTRSRLAALASGMIYGMCGFMMVHLGHTAIIHAAVWLPLIIWSIEMLRQNISRKWIAMGCVAVACCVLAGHLQIVSYSLTFGAAYAVVFGWNAPAGRRRFYSTCLLMMAIGIGLTALQILPAVELASFSTRSNFAFSDFVSYSLPYKHLLLLLYPAAFGGLPRYGTTPYFGDWNLTEMSSYVGVLGLMLVAIGVTAGRRKPAAMFWLCAGGVALLLALGDRTPLATLIYQVPVIGKFRAPARHVIELSFACSVLAGFGIDAVRRQQVTRRVVLVTIAAGALIMIIALLILRSEGFQQYARANAATSISWSPLTNPAVGIPLLVFSVAAAVLWFWTRNQQSPWRQLAVLVVLALDLASFGWFYAWHDFAPGKEVLAPPSIVDNYKQTLASSHQRMVSARGTLGGVNELPPNLSRLWGVPNATGYGPLTLATVTDLLSLLPDGSLHPRWNEPGDQSLNLASARYIFLPQPEKFHDEREVLWVKENMDIWLGSGCDHPPRELVRFEVPSPFTTDTLAVVTRLACSTEVADDEEVVRFVIRNRAGATQTLTMLAGKDSAEWAYDCPNVKPGMKHARAQVFNSFATKMYDTPCEGHYYVALLKLERPLEISEVEAQWVGKTGAMILDKISLVNRETNSSVPLNPLDAAGSNWRFSSATADAVVYENRTVLPRVWLAGEAIALNPDEILKAIKTSALPDGRMYDPTQTVLVEENQLAVAAPKDASATASVVALTDKTMEIRTSSASGSFLVTSDTWYPGWQATVDGAPASIFRANYALRGVRVPAGSHLVKFEYRPTLFYLGTAISVLSLLGLAAILTVPFAKYGIAGSKVDTNRPSL